MTAITPVRCDLEIPDEAVRYILYQRTAYLRLPITRLYRHLLRHLPINLPIYNAAVSLESRFGKDRIKALYRRHMLAEFGTISAFLPGSCSAILDIGCGVAGINVLLDRHYAGQNPEIYLLDRSEVAPSVYYMFEPQGAFYNSLDVARTVLTGNGVADERIHTMVAGDRYEIAIQDRKVDLIISLLSWGFHYPVQTYADAVFKLIGENGRVILDIRKGTNGLAFLRGTCSRVDNLLEAEKYVRVGVRP